MEFLEKDLEEIIFNSCKDKLHEKGLNVYGKMKRQVKIGSYGIADLIVIKKPYYHSVLKYYAKGEISIIELKQNNISVSSFLQAVQYLKGVKRYLEKRKKLDLFNYNITLIGKNIDLNSSFVYLADLFEHINEELDISKESTTSIDLYTYLVDIDGLKFLRHKDYIKINEKL